MNGIAEKLSKKRTEMGVSIEEAAEDLNYDVIKLESIETGNFKNFEDIFVLKCVLGDYAKYLGFDSDKIIDEFNDFVFESTSKIPLDEIQKASKNKDKNSDDMIASPYRVEDKKKNYLVRILIIITIILVIAAICLYFYNQSIKENDGGLKVSVGEIYEG